MPHIHSPARANARRHVAVLGLSIGILERARPGEPSPGNRDGPPAVVPPTMTTRAPLLASLLLVFAGCAGPSTDVSPTPVPVPVTTPGTGIGGVVTAGPVCPVEKNPPDPACAPRPVDGAIMVVRDAAGTEVARVTTVVDGTYFVELPAGFYVVMPQPAKGLLGTPGPQSVTVPDGAAARLDLSYDTGVR